MGKKGEKMRILIVCNETTTYDASASHKGTLVSITNTAKVLTRAGMPTETWVIKSQKEFWDKLTTKAPAPNPKPFTHIIISTLFLSTEFVRALAQKFPHTKFAVCSHSNVGFLQSEPEAISLLRELMHEEVAVMNLYAAGNSKRMCDALQFAYGEELTHLPNLYFLTGEERGRRVTWDGGVLRIGLFGAARVQKNFSTAVVAALIIARELKAETQIWMNGGRNDKNANIVHRAVKAWLDGVPNVSLHTLPWTTWPVFRRHVATQHLLIQPSYSESFNLVTADGIAEGVPSVVSDAIYWVPPHWQANSDDATDVARVGRSLIFDKYAVVDGIAALKEYNDRALGAWQGWLKA